MPTISHKDWRFRQILVDFQNINFTVYTIHINSITGFPLGRKKKEQECNAGSTVHSSSKRLKPAKNKSPCCNFPSFYKKVLADSHDFHSLNAHRINYEFLQTVASISMTSQFHDFLGSNFWRVFAVWNHSAVAGSISIYDLGGCFLVPSMLSCGCRLRTEMRPELSKRP